MRYGAALICASVGLLAQLAPSNASMQSAPGASTEQTTVILHRVRGTVDYQTAAMGNPVAVSETQTFDEKAFVSTQFDSIGALDFPDASRLTLGGNSSIQAYAFHSRWKHVRRQHDKFLWEGSTIRLPGNAAAFRLDVRQPEEGESTYVVVTRFATIVMRGTSTLLADSLSGDTVTCVDCGAGDVVANVAGQDYAVNDGQTLTIGPPGRVSIVPTSDSVMLGFAAAGLPTDRLPPPPPEKRTRWNKINWPRFR